MHFFQVPIGSGKTLIPRHIYNQIQWSSYTQATRKLLMAVFPRKYVVYILNYEFYNPFLDCLYYIIF